ncbi:hypothetical protein SAMN04487943_103201 [Gracilibacillus orientalis]|uniref:Uncharacterized protein n=1 Tax=Gracilibacillus orientalis TaxID=334253 RepID=A0A1I4JVP7_9BACI|nr:hypothetical protein [Gracilibacillus orientalis]SFL70620.1 hypothetical protein SAMN04487943_103201 [Gracilibacillus orientalis]
MKKLLIVIIVLLALFLILPVVGINIFPLFWILGLIEWSTKFILPWIVLYWLIKLVITLEKDK